jgi:hypothetical protein
MRVSMRGNRSKARSTVAGLPEGMEQTCKHEEEHACDPQITTYQRNNSERGAEKIGFVYHPGRCQAGKGSGSRGRSEKTRKSSML